jgi:phosphatidylserine/phosphatidylglycerophosphate/cardiolipin synthase-like enzyme
MMMEGDVAQALDELGRDRWVRAGGRPLDPLDEEVPSAWPDDLEPHFEDVEVGIARTRAAYKGEPAINEIERLFVEQIARAKHFIYAENQYFASRVIAEAVSRRLAEDDPPEFVLVQPATADGWIESHAMDPARTLLLKAIREVDRQDRFHLYTPVAGKTAIYVHAKLMIVDDEILRIGSANFNNRSLGLDSECDVFIDCARPTNGHCTPAIRALRHRLLAEHLDLKPEEVGELVDQAGSMAGMIAALGPDRVHTLQPFHPAELSDLEADVAQRELLDPEEPADMFVINPPRRGLFRRGSLLSRAMKRMNNRRRRALAGRAA